MKHDLVALREDLKKSGIDVSALYLLRHHGITRSKDVLVSQLDKSAENGPAFCQGVWVTNTRGDVLDADNIASDGLQDMISQLDPTTIKPMPWEPGVAYVVVDAYNPDGTDNMLSPRSVLRKVIAEYKALGLHPVVGPELEFYIADRIEGGGFKRSLTRTGRVYYNRFLGRPKWNISLPNENARPNGYRSFCR
jgi:glutamine synthetase